VSAPPGNEREAPPSAALLDGDDPALFPKLTEHQLALLRPLGQVREIEVDDVLFSDGDAAYDPMLVLAGRVSVLERGDRARELVDQQTGDLMVELNLFTGQPVGATGVVREAGSVLVVPAAEFRALVGRELVFGDFVLQLLFRRRQALERLLLGVRIVGSRFDRDTHRLREFAARNRVAHEWIESDAPRAGRLLSDLGLSASGGPAVLLGGTRALPNPTNAELAEALGLHDAAPAGEKIFDLVVVGGANSAGQAALALAEVGRHVFLVVREVTLARTMAAYLRERIAREPAIELMLSHEVRRVEGDDHLGRVGVEETASGAARTLQAGTLVVLIGATPHTDWLEGTVALDADGFALTGSALGAGLREHAPAVGEGGMAIRFAAEHLARTGTA
jgi:thioredoxin reductase (NADPH)